MFSWADFAMGKQVYNIEAGGKLKYSYGLVKRFCRWNVMWVKQVYIT